MASTTEKLFGLTAEVALADTHANQVIQDALERLPENPVEYVDIDLDPTSKPELWEDRMLDMIRMNRPLFNLTQQEEVRLMSIYHKMIYSGILDEQFKYLLLHMIMTMPDPFDRRKTTLFGEYLQTENPQILDYPVDKVALLASPSFGATDAPAPTDLSSKVTEKKEVIKIKADDKAFFDWYSRDSNFKSAKVFFGQWSILLFKVCIKEPETIHQHLQFKFPSRIGEFSDYPGPIKMMTINTNLAPEVANILKREQDFNRGILKYIILWFKKSLSVEKKQKVDAYFSYAIKVGFYAHGFHLLHQMKMAAQYMAMKQGKLLSLLMAIEHPTIAMQVMNLHSGIKLINLFQSNTSIMIGDRKVTFGYWPYSRFFDGRCFMELSVRKNSELMAFLIGTLPTRMQGARNARAMSLSDSEVRNFMNMGRDTRITIWKKQDPDASNFVVSVMPNEEDTENIDNLLPD